MPGYSGTPLWKKLGLKAEMRAAVMNPPAGYRDVLLEDAPELIWGELDAGVFFTHIFSSARSELEFSLKKALDLMDRNGMIWVSWPKKASKRPTDITEDTIREICLPMGLVDVKVCAVDDVWSGLKLMIRKELR